MRDALFIFIIKSFFNKENMYESYAPHMASSLLLLAKESFYCGKLSLSLTARAYTLMLLLFR